MLLWGEETAKILKNLRLSGLACAPADPHTFPPALTSLLAKELHCNADYLGRIYKRKFHLTLTEAIQRQRVRAAEKLLLNNSLALKEVAEQCGFNDVSYFRLIFRKITGLTPAVWKKRYCKGTLTPPKIIFTHAKGWFLFLSNPFLFSFLY
jgi:AraC-like DNA-binding protein